MNINKLTESYNKVHHAKKLLSSMITQLASGTTVKSPHNTNPIILNHLDNIVEDALEIANELDKAELSKNLAYFRKLRTRYSAHEEIQPTTHSVQNAPNFVHSVDQLISDNLSVDYAKQIVDIHNNMEELVQSLGQTIKP